MTPTVDLGAQPLDRRLASPPQLSARRQHTDEPVPWRALFAAHFDQRWIAQDALDGGLIEITSEALQEPPITRLDDHGRTSRCRRR